MTLIQIDPTAAVAPSADLVAWSRLGNSYQPEQLRKALESDRTLFEYDATIRPIADVGLMFAGMAEWPRGARVRDWMHANDNLRRDILDLLRRNGPSLSRDIPDTSVVPWGSTGWTNNRNVTQMMEFLAIRGDIAISGRQGRQRLWDLAERVYPPVPRISVGEATRLRNERRLQALGIARPKSVAVPIEPNDVGDVGEPALVEGTAGLWRVDPQALGQPFTGRTAILSPFDRLVYDRARALEIFQFEYVLEMYKPADKRRWGYFALPILHNDRLVGKVDATADRKAGILRIHALHEDTPLTKKMSMAIGEELAALAAWLELSLDPRGI